MKYKGGNGKKQCLISLGELWLVFDSDCCIEVVRDVRVEEAVGLHSPVQTDGDDPVLLETEAGDDVLISNIYCIVLIDLNDPIKIVDDSCNF